MMQKTIVTGLLGMALGVSTLSAQTVDVHTHIIIPEYLEVLKAYGAELEETFPLPAWDMERHIAFMDSASIRTAVLTMPAPQPYYDDAEESAKCIRKINEVSAEIKRRYPPSVGIAANEVHTSGNGEARLYAADRLGKKYVATLFRLGRQPNERSLTVVTHYYLSRSYPLWFGLPLLARLRAESQPAKAQTDARFGQSTCRIY